MRPTLLLADDSVTIQRVIELTFADEDISVIAVGDGDGAIETAARKPPDIVLADVGMPGRNGYEVARHFRETPALSHIPVLLLTGAFERIDEERVREAGANGVLTKPFEPQIVVRRVRELLGPKLRESSPTPAVVKDAAAKPDPLAAVAKPETTVLRQDTITIGPPALEMPGKPAPPESNAVLDDYFERLDQAFAARATQLPAPTPAPVEPPMADQPKPDTAADRATLAGAFSELLAAEQSAHDPRLAQLAAPAPVKVEISDALVEQVARRVLERLTDRVIRETVSEITTATAERLVVEEIERIKSLIK